MEKGVGAKLATVRAALGLSPETLAGRSAMDAADLGRIERGEAEPSLAELIRLTRALGVRLGTLVDDETELGPVITRRDGARKVGRVRTPGPAGKDGAIGFFSLASGKASRHMEPFLLDVEPAAGGDDGLSSHEGEEFLYVLEGEVELRYGSAAHLVGAGDSVYFDSIVPHRVRGVGRTARVLAVVYAPM
jgi:mannose-6-phosphate isomerase-like protein (cupin superfamily)